MAAANVDQEPDSIVPDTKCLGCNKLKDHVMKTKLLIILHHKQILMYYVPYVFYALTKTIHLLSSAPKAPLMVTLLLHTFTKLSSTDVLKYSKKVYLLSVCRSL